MKPSSHETGHQLHENLRQHLACAELLLSTLDRERVALLANDVDALERIAQTKSSAAENMRDLGSALASLRLRSNAPSVPELLHSISDPAGLFEDWQRLLDLAGRCQRTNLENSALLEARQAQVRSALRLVQGAQEPSTYGRAGFSPGGLVPRSLGTA